MASLSYDVHVVVCFTILVLCALFTFIFIIKTWTKNTWHTLDIIIKLVFLLSSLFFILNVIFDLLSYSKSVIRITYTIGFALYLLGLPLMLFSFACRLKKMHKTMQLRTECRDISQVIVIFLAVIIQILSFILMVCVTLMNLMSLALINYLVFSLTNLVSNVALLCTFGHKIHTLGQQTHTYDLHDESHTINSGELAIELTKSIESSTETKSKSKSSTQRTDSTKINSKQKPKAMRRPRIIKSKLLTKTIRNMTGAMIAFISSNLLSILGIYQKIYNSNQTLWIVYLMFITMDQTIILLCLYLQHKQSRRWYNMHCAMLHGCMAKLLIGHGNASNNKNVCIKSENMVSLGDHAIRAYSATSTLTGSSAPCGLPHLRKDCVTDLDTSNTTSLSLPEFHKYVQQYK
eukprot:749727_1